MNREFEEWKMWIERLPEELDDFGRWLFVRVAGVLLACKAGELVMLGDGQCRMTIGEQLKSIGKISEIWNYSWIALPRHGSRARVMIYDQDRVRSTLARTPRWVFDKMGYPHDIEPAEFLEEVGRRWTRKEQIPHEIGLALGYPVKDVLGYMGLIPLPCTGNCGWCIHGNPRASLARSRDFREAREKALAFLGMLAGQGNPGRVTASAPTL
jgi:hypothetical protein